MYYSDIFVTRDTRRADLFQVIPKFEQYIYNVYNETGITTGDPMGNAGCEDGNPSRAAAEKRVGDVLRSNQNYLPRKGAIAACTAQKVLQSLKTDEHGQKSFNSNESQYTLACARNQ